MPLWCQKKAEQRPEWRGHSSCFPSGHQTGREKWNLGQMLYPGLLFRDPGVLSGEEVRNWGQRSPFSLGVSERQARRGKQSPRQKGPLGLGVDEKYQRGRRGEKPSFFQSLRLGSFTQRPFPVVICKEAPLRDNPCLFILLYWG